MPVEKILGRLRSTFEGAFFMFSCAKKNKGEKNPQKVITGYRKIDNCVLLYKRYLTEQLMYNDFG